MSENTIEPILRSLKTTSLPFKQPAVPAIVLHKSWKLSYVIDPDTWKNGEPIESEYFDFEGRQYFFELHYKENATLNHEISIYLHGLGDTNHQVGFGFAMGCDLTHCLCNHVSTEGNVHSLEDEARGWDDFFKLGDLIDACEKCGKVRATEGSFMIGLQIWRAKSFLEMNISEKRAEVKRRFEQFERECDDVDEQLEKLQSSCQELFFYKDMVKTAEIKSQEKLREELQKFMYHANATFGIEMQRACTICYDPYREPVALNPCGHVFCKGCVTNFPTISCPICRAAITECKKIYL